MTLGNSQPLIIFLLMILCGCAAHVEPKPKAGLELAPEIVNDVTVKHVGGICHDHKWKVEFSPSFAARFGEDSLYVAHTDYSEIDGEVVGGYGKSPSEAIADGEQRLCEFEKKLAKFKAMEPKR